jgi:hypothetical protein
MYGNPESYPNFQQKEQTKRGGYLRRLGDSDELIDYSSVFFHRWGRISVLPNAA